jgi:hypothetical protein
MSQFHKSGFHALDPSPQSLVSGRYFKLVQEANAIIDFKLDALAPIFE